MNAIKAFLWKDFLRFRPLLALWMLVLTAWAVSAGSREWKDPAALDNAMVVLVRGMPLLMAALLVMADGPARRRLEVHARPVTRTTFVLTKCLGMLWMIVLPLMLAHAAVFWAHGLSAALAARALGEMLVLVLARCALAGCMAAMCEGIGDWVRGVVVLALGCVLAAIAVRLQLTGQDYLAGLALFGVWPMVSLPDLRQLPFLGVAAVSLSLSRSVCSRAGWIGGWTRWAGATLTAALTGWLLGTAAHTGMQPGGPDGLVIQSLPADPRGNEERPWLAVDQALANEVVEKAELIPGAQFSYDNRLRSWVSSAVVGQYLQGLPEGVFVDWRCRHEPKISGPSAAAGWRIKATSANWNPERDRASDAAKAAVSGRVKDMVSASGLAMSQVFFGAELGSVLRPENQPFEGEVSFDAVLTGRVWRWRIVREIPEGGTAEWRDDSGNGDWKIQYRVNGSGMTIQRRKLSLAWPATLDQSGQAQTGWWLMSRGGIDDSVNSPVGFYAERQSSGWWERWDTVGGGYLDMGRKGAMLILLKLEFLGQAERRWSSGPVRFEKQNAEEQPRNFLWPEFGSLKLVDYLADLERSRPDPVTCGEEAVRRYLWKACRGLAFARVTGWADMEKAARHLAPLAGSFRETFLQGWSRVGCWQNQLLKEALRQGLPEAEFKALKLPES